MKGDKKYGQAVLYYEGACRSSSNRHYKSIQSGSLCRVPIHNYKQEDCCSS